MSDVVIVAGPTASGKSALALALAEEFSGTVINADSMQVYRDLHVLTARPGREEEARAPHRLYGVIDAAEACSAGRWRNMARVEVEAAQAAGRLPILAGGTGLYLHAWLHGLAAVPEVPQSARAAARALHAELGGAAFRARLAELDPAAAVRLPAGDTQRLVRAYEVVTATGRTLGEWQQLAVPPSRAASAPIAIVLLPPRAALYAACDARVIAMVEDGALEEVAALRARGLPPELPALKAVGLRELALCLDGMTTRADAIAAAQQATRRYAKRQYTWLRHRMAGMRTLPVEAQFSESLLPGIFSFIRQSLLTGKI
ncbi:MAG TPA: tRNA (adenosine(37)-N6)-dimethylallyltransferase MiaA [Stellaceae bacterium]|nr:tRNA (adenosine(37)-N6)-dimethylallyltransferase MiaA [Stellaceae bacterium]